MMLNSWKLECLMLNASFFIILVSDFEQTNERGRTRASPAQASPPVAFRNRFGVLCCDAPVGRIRICVAKVRGLC